MDEAKTPEGVKGAEPSESSDTPEITKLGEDIGEARTSKPGNSPELADEESVAAAAAEAKKSATLPFPLKMTQQTWLIAATMLIGLVTLLIFGRMTGGSKAAGERREERTVESLTPESLMARCGAPAEDVTKDLYPMIKRTMSYKSSVKGTLTLEFTRTAEEKSDWVFLSMSDENGATYSTPETQMAAMPCLK